MKAERKKQLDNQTAWTPAVSLVVGLADVLRQIREETREGVFARTGRLAKATVGGLSNPASYAPQPPRPFVDGDIYSATI